MDLTQHRVRALDRAAPYPQDVVEEVYGFDDLEEAQIAEVARRCHALARVLGFGKQVMPDDEGVWRVADPSHPSFAEAVPEGALNDESSFVTRGRCGLVRIDEEWTFAEFVANQREGDWKLEKGALARQDFRVLALSKDKQGRRFIGPDEALTLYRDEPQKEWPFSGPRVVGEYLRSLRDGGLNFKTTTPNG